MTGWCPIHDRTFQAADGLCPKCGTALVVDEASGEEHPTVIDVGDEPEPEIPPAVSNERRRTGTIAGVVAAIVIAFVAGLAFPSARQRDEGAPAGPLEVAADLSIGVTFNSAGVPLRLESFSQRGQRVVIRVTVPSREIGFDLGRLRSAEVAFQFGDGGEISDRLPARNTVSGFILEGSVLPRADTPVLVLRINALEFEVHGEARVSLDLRGVWPADASNEPRARGLSATLAPGDPGPEYRVTGVVGWADRLEFGVEVRGDRPGWVYNSEFLLVGEGVSSRSPLLGGPDTYTIAFRDISRDVRAPELVVTVSLFSVFGGWEWSFV